MTNLSTHPHPPKEAEIILNKKVKRFKLTELFDGVCATRPKKESKGEFIEKILKKSKIPKTKALMVGEGYIWDYKPAKDVGVDAILIGSRYESNGHRVGNEIKKLVELVGYL